MKSLMCVFGCVAALALNVWAQGGGTAFITWLESGNNCVLLSATNPSAPAASWAPVTSGITDFGLVKVYAAHFAPGEPTRYYRLRCP